MWHFALHHLMLIQLLQKEFRQASFSAAINNMYFIQLIHQILLAEAFLSVNEAPNVMHYTK